MTTPWFDTRTAVKGWLLVLAFVSGLVWLYLAYGRADIQVDGPVVRQETNWFRGATSGMDAIVGGELEYVDGCVLLSGDPVVWPETVSWDEDREAVLVRGEPLPWASDTEGLVTGAGGMSSDFDLTADASWDDDDLTPETAPCHFATGASVVIFNADSELEVTFPDG